MSATDAKRCWIFHRWSRWEKYTMPMQSVFTRGPKAGEIVHGSDMRQRRTCLRCGRWQDEAIEW